MTLSNGHQRGLGLGMSIEWLKPDEGTLAALSSEISWPLLQERDPLARVDWAGSFALMGAVHPTFFVGAKVGMNINAMGGPVGLLALSIRHLPKDQSAFGFLQWVEKQIDIGLHANKNLYAAVRLGFSLL